jgi:hypothetical protein
MNAYQRFIEFFSMCNKERLDGLSESYFEPMTREERLKAFNYLLKLVEQGGSEETINGIFMADSDRAVEPVTKLLESGALNDEAQIAAAWNLYRIREDDNLISIFIKFMSSSDRRLREKAAYYVPADKLTNDLKDALHGMIRTETVRLARIHAVDKLLNIYGISEESVGEKNFLKIYRGLHSEDVAKKEATFTQLDELYE